MKPEDITAWALNELSPEERAQIEAALAAEPQAQQKARETKAFCALLSEHLVDEDAALAPEQREKLAAIELPQPDNVVTFTAGAETPRMNGKAFHAKVTAAREQAELKSSPWLRIAALAACLVFTVLVIDQARNIPTPAPTPQVLVADGAELTVKLGKNERSSSIADQVNAPKPASNYVIGSTVTPTSLPSLTEKDHSMSEVVKDYPPPEIPAAFASNPASPGSAGVLSKSGAGTISLSRANTYSGGIVVNGGAAMATTSGQAVSSAPAPSTRNTVGQGLAFGSTAIKPNSVVGSIPSIQQNVTGAIKPASVDGLIAARGDAMLDSFDKPAVKFQFSDEPPSPTPTSNTERYAAIIENPFVKVISEPLSTFSIDVDTASYANVRRYLNGGFLPPPDAVRLEELINYFPYDYEQPGNDQPFSVQVDLAEAPWAPQHRLARVAIKGRDVGLERKAANFVFLVDVSGSMSDSNKLPLVQQSLLMLTEQLQDNDRVAIVTYAGESGVALESTSGKDKPTIIAAIKALHSGGSTNGASGITLAYDQAAAHFIKEGINRVILATDGDFNVGISSNDALEKLIKEKAKSGTFLSVLGFGTGNLQDSKMITLADRGNGNYAYIDSLGEARKVLVEQMHGTLITIAKDVKIQVEFNPAIVASYRLIGYEKRMLAAQDFNNDKKDAGEIGAGHTITALYEIVPVGLVQPNGAIAAVDDLKYQPKDKPAAPMLNARPPEQKLVINDESMTVKLRYKAPDGELSKLIEVPVKDTKKTLTDAPRDFRFATAVAGFGLLLRGSEHVEEFTFEAVRRLALQGKGEDALGYRGEFIQLIDKAQGVSATRGR